MGVLNLTPDSFSDGGKFLNKNKAFNQVHHMIKSGASIIDIGGESTKPGSKQLNEKDEWKRIESTITKVRNKFPNITLSVDTRKAGIMNKAIEKGVNIINDISGLNFDAKSFNLLSSFAGDSV